MMLLHPNLAINACFQTLLIVNYHIKLSGITNMMNIYMNIFNHIFNSEQKYDTCDIYEYT